MKNYFVGIAALAIGLYILVYPAKSAERVIESQNKFWGFRFADKELRSAKIILIICACLSVVFGVLSLFGIIKFK